MPEQDQIVINTGPIIALIAALGDLSILKSLYRRIVVPREVATEVLAGGRAGFGVQAFRDASFLCIESEPRKLAGALKHSLDLGEASVIQAAMDYRIQTVCIDEAVGRRVARLHELLVTGSLGVILKAIRAGHDIDLESCIARMRDHGVWISPRTSQRALELAARQ